MLLALVALLYVRANALIMPAKHDRHIDRDFYTLPASSPRPPAENTTDLGTGPRLRDHYDWQKAQFLFQAFSDVLTSQNIPFFLMYGSLLQWYRDGNINEKDHDIDVAVLAEDWNRIAWLEIGPRAAHLSGVAELGAWPYKVKYETFDRNGVTAPRKFLAGPLTGSIMFDVWVLHNGRPGRRAICSGWDEKSLRVEEIPEFDVRPAKLWNISMSVPSDEQVEEALENMYGPSWRIPLVQNETDDIWIRTHRASCATYFTDLEVGSKEYIFINPFEPVSNRENHDSPRYSKYIYGPYWIKTPEMDPPLSNYRNSFHERFEAASNYKYDPDWLKLLLYIFISGVFMAIHAWFYGKQRVSILIGSLYCCYIALHVLCSATTYHYGKEMPRDFMTHELAGCIVAAALLIKICVSLMLFVMEPIPAEQSRLSARFGDVSAAKATLPYLVVPGMLYTAADALLVYVQQGMPMAQVQVVSKLGVPISTLMWVCVFQSQITFWKLSGLFFICCGSMIYVIPCGSRDAWSVDGRLFCMLAQVGLSCAGSVSCELFLRKYVGSMNLQNATMYAWGFIFLAITGQVHFDFFGKFSHGEWIVVFLLASVGITTGMFLKHLGNIWKQVAYGSMLIVYSMVDALVFNNVASINQFAGLYVTLLGTFVCISDSLAGLSSDGGEGQTKRAD